MHNPFVVGKLQCVANLWNDRQRLRRRQVPVGHQLPQIGPVRRIPSQSNTTTAAVLSPESAAENSHLAEIVHGDDVGVVDAGPKCGLRG